MLSLHDALPICWEIDKDIIEITRLTQSYPKTALYGRGASLETEGGGFSRLLTFEDVEWSVANGDPVDKPKGQKWVGDMDALQHYGRRMIGGRNLLPNTLFAGSLGDGRPRSEEHTSELQSRGHLVCRLLLEK